MQGRLAGLRLISSQQLSLQLATHQVSPVVPKDLTVQTLRLHACGLESQLCALSTRDGGSFLPGEGGECPRDEFSLSSRDTHCWKITPGGKGATLGGSPTLHGGPRPQATGVAGLTEGYCPNHLLFRPHLPFTDPHPTSHFPPLRPQVIPHGWTLYVPAHSGSFPPLSVASISCRSPSHPPPCCFRIPYGTDLHAWRAVALNECLFN